MSYLMLRCQDNYPEKNRRTSNMSMGKKIYEDTYVSKFHRYFLFEQPEFTCRTRNFTAASRHKQRNDTQSSVPVQPSQ